MAKENIGTIISAGKTKSNIMAKRDDSKEFFASGKPFLVLLRDGWYCELDDFLLGESHSEEWDEMRNCGISVEAGIYFLESEAINRIRCLIEVFGYSAQVLYHLYDTVFICLFNPAINQTNHHPPSSP